MIRCAQFLHADPRHTHSRQPVTDYGELVQLDKFLLSELCSEQCECNEATDRKSSGSDQRSGVKCDKGGD
jgi:hypothetical protein